MPIYEKDPNMSREDYILACAEEMVKIRRDPVYFITNYVKFDVLDKTSNEAKTINLYKEQKQVLEAFQDNHFVVILGSRQCGKTAIMEALCVWVLISFNNYDILHLNRTGTNGSTVVREVRSMLEALPVWLKPVEYVVDNTQHIKLPNGSSMKAEPSGGDPKNKGRGLRPLLIWVDECAFAPNMDALSTAVFPGMIKRMIDAEEMKVPYGIILTSTPNGTTGHGAYFCTIWQQAIDKRSRYIPIEIYWKNLPDRNKAWFDLVAETILNNDPRKINQELELKFLGSSTTLLSDDIIANLKKENPIKKERTVGGDIWWYQEPDEKKGYLIGIDTATEHGLDYSALTILDFDTMEQVADYRGKCRIKDFIYVIKEIDKKLFGNTVLLPEKQGVGNQTIEEIMADEVLNPKLFYTSKVVKGKSVITKGINTTKISRPLMIDSLYEFCKEFPDLLKSERLIGECCALERKQSGKVEASAGMTDDLAISLALITYVKVHCNLAEFKPGGVHWSSDKEVMGMFDGSIKSRNAMMSQLNVGEEDAPRPTIQLPVTQVDGVTDLAELFETISKQLEEQNQ